MGSESRYEKTKRIIQETEELRGEFIFWVENNTESSISVPLVSKLREMGLGEIHALGGLCEAIAVEAIK